MTEPLTQSERNAPVPPWSLMLAALIVVAAVALVIRAADPGEALRTRLLVAWLITAGFAFIAYAMRAVSGGGAVAGGVICFTLYAAAGPGAFAALVSVFLLASISTRIGYARKQTLGKAENRHGRSAAQVLANLTTAAALAALAAVLTGAWPTVLLVASAAALAEAAGDTVSSECGEAWAARARLITTLEPVAPGTDGGLSVPGTLAGMLAVIAVACVCAAVRMISPAAILLVSGAAVAGVFFDSLLGATLQRRGLMGNNGVNVAGTVFAGAIALALAAL